MFSISQLEEVIEVNAIIGDRQRMIGRVVQLDVHNGDDGALMWCSEKNYEKLKQLEHGVVICKQVKEEDKKEGVTYICTDQPRRSFMKILQAFFVQKRAPSISGKATIHETAKIGEGCYVGDHAVIEANVVMGNNCVIDHNTVIKEGTKIGNRVVIGCNCSIGGVGFGYEKEEDGDFELIPHIGNVVIEDDVEIGNNTCIDRAVMGSTVLHENVKVDNLVHIAHGVVVGRNSMVIANAMVAGSVVIGKNSWIAPSASILNQKTVGDDVVIGLGAVVLKDVVDGATIVGNPGEDIREFLQKKKAIQGLMKGDVKQ